MSKLKIYSFFGPNVYVVFALLFLQSACTSTTVDEFRQGQTGITTEESVVILGRRQGNEYETREEFVGCVGDRVSSGKDAITVIPEREFIDAMFPWFEPRTAPIGISNLERLMADELVATNGGIWSTVHGLVRWFYRDIWANWVNLMHGWPWRRWMLWFWFVGR
jgi:hypothetical protein